MKFPLSNSYSGQNSQGFSWENLINHYAIYKFSPATVFFFFVSSQITQLMNLALQNKTPNFPQKIADK